MHSPEAPAPDTTDSLLNAIQSYFAILANAERLSLAKTEESDVLCLEDATSMGAAGLDLVEKLREMLEPSKDTPSSPKPDTREPLAELKSLPLDQVVMLHLHSGQSFTGALGESPDGQIILFEPFSDKSSRYHTVPGDSIAAWSDLRGEHAEPLFLLEREYLPHREIKQRLEKIVRSRKPG
jgi:hypothetical protein